ncbi:hypothetical protein [Granulicella arctica]|uniref:Uncharacterized protein n=1 Tax=Granulicella arctica TaxID=940613 RepID=A0A7Y9TRM8_9BACT|nr:hypothetical protein [Granulicella arctica]NYF78358.1 hypothetical protein [Granulicella arctica]
MSEFDFEELLDGVLREDVWVEPLVGMNERVMARISAETGRSSRRWVAWAAIAASAFVAAGMLVWVRPNVESHERRADLTDAHSQVVPRDEVVVSKSDTLILHTKVNRKHSSILLREPPLRVDPIEIEPLTIEPIEIASLTAESRDGNGEVR